MRALAALLLISSYASAAPTPPADIKGGLQSGAIVRVFKNLDPWSILFEATGEKQSEDREAKDFTIGSYYQLSDHVRAGVFYRRAYGLRHDEDWHSVAGVWSWRDSNSRGEDLLIFDLSGKALLHGTPLTAELKLRYLFNEFNDNRTLLVRPGISYHWIEGAQLRANVFLNFEVDFPLNYGTETATERWIYFGGLYHFTKSFDLGPFAAVAWKTWGRPQGYLDKGGGPYSTTTQSTTLGLVAVFSLQ